MPKEVIRETIAGDGFELVLGWSAKAQAVQVATCAPDMPLVTPDASHERNGWHVNLDAAGVDQAIRVLRRIQRAMA